MQPAEFRAGSAHPCESRGLLEKKVPAHRESSKQFIANYLKGEEDNPQPDSSIVNSRVMNVHISTAGAPLKLRQHLTRRTRMRVL
jgi:hypothetical protein